MTLVLVLELLVVWMAVGFGIGVVSAKHFHNRRDAATTSDPRPRAGVPTGSEVVGAARTHGPLPTGRTFL